MRVLSGIPRSFFASLVAACWGNVVEAPRNSDSDFFVALSRTSESVRPSGRARRQRCCLLLKPTHTIASSLLFCSLSSLGSRSLLTRCCPLCATCAQLSPLVMPAATYDASMSTPALNRVLSKASRRPTSARSVGSNTRRSLSPHHRPSRSSA